MRIGDRVRAVAETKIGDSRPPIISYLACAGYHRSDIQGMSIIDDSIATLKICFLNDSKAPETDRCKMDFMICQFSLWLKLNYLIMLLQRLKRSNTCA